MNSRTAFGIVGGYGSTGFVVASELLKNAGVSIVIGGRDLSKATAAAAKLGSTVTAAQVDVFDDRSLDEFCGRCSIVINCAGPVMILQDRVAQAAFRQRCHYVDVAGLSFVKARMLPHHREMTGLGLSCVASAGWLPGVTELVPAYAYTQAKLKMEAIESLTAYQGDSGEWSTTAYREMVFYLRAAGLPKPGFFRKGERVRVPMSRAAAKADLGPPLGECRFNLFSMPEMDEFAARCKDCDVSSYTYVPGTGAALTAAMIAVLPLPHEFAVRRLQKALRGSPLPVGGFVVVRVVGRSQGRPVTSTVAVIYKRGLEYWINGIVPATLARLIAEGNSVQPGVNFLIDAVDPATFLSQLRNAGVELTEKLDTP